MTLSADQIDRVTQGSPDGGGAADRRRPIGYGDDGRFDSHGDGDLIVERHAFEGDQDEGASIEERTRRSHTALSRLEALRRRNACANWVNRDLYRWLYKTDLYGAVLQQMETRFDGGAKDQANLEIFHRAVELMVNRLRDESFQFGPGPLGPSKQALLAVIHCLLESIYDSPYGPFFLESSHRGRPARNPHTALKCFRQNWSEVVWIVRGSIPAWSTKRQHPFLMRQLEEKIADGRFLKLLHKAMRAGCVGPRKEPCVDSTIAGALYSLLTNVLLHPLDMLVESHRKEDADSIQFLRHGGDWILGVKGPKSRARRLQNEIEGFLRESLDFVFDSANSSEANTTPSAKILHAKKRPVLFLGVRLGVSSADGEQSAQTVMKPPIDQLVKRLWENGFCQRDGFPTSKTTWVNLDVEQIVSRYNRLLGGLLSYYRFADSFVSMKRIQHVLHYSLAMTLAHKHRTSVRQVFKRYGPTLRYSPSVQFAMNRRWRTCRDAFSTKPVELDQLSWS